MSTRGLVHNDSLIFDGTNYDVWKIRMLKHFRVMDPNIERIVDMGFSPPKDPQNLSIEDEKNSYLDAQASNVLFNVVSIVVFIQSCLIGMLMRCGQSFKINMMSPRFMRMIVPLPPPTVMSVSAHLLPLHQHVICHKVMIW